MMELDAKTRFAQTTRIYDADLLFAELEVVEYETERLAGRLVRELFGSTERFAEAVFDARVATLRSALHWMLGSIAAAICYPLWIWQIGVFEMEYGESAVELAWQIPFVIGVVVFFGGFLAAMAFFAASWVIAHAGEAILSARRNRSIAWVWRKLWGF